MPPRTLLRRLLVLRTAKLPNATRLFTRHTNVSSRKRPQLPFLSVPLARNHQFRYLTTERKRWLAYEMVLGIKYTINVWAILGLGILGYWTVQQEWLERHYPSPWDWTFVSRWRFRLARWAPDRTDAIETDWVEVGNYAKNVLERLEDPKIDGADLREQELLDGGVGGVWIDGIGKPGYDATAKSEPWRRGYYEILMLAAKAAEHLSTHVVDKTRKLVFPADQVIGPSNPNPKPIPHGAQGAPREEDCEPAYEPPDTFYMRILTTKGFTAKQKLDAALEYASWLDFKGAPEASDKMYEWALSLATDGASPAPPPYDPQSYVLKDSTQPPSANILATLTALATHKARNGEVSQALPIFISILRARKTLPPPQSASDSDADSGVILPWYLDNALGRVIKPLLSPPYPPPPPDGTAPPPRDARELCEEAALDLYIGEIIFARQGREDGLAWTREAVDLAEEQLHKLGTSPTSTSTTSDAAVAAARKTCRECLGSGLENWGKMVARLAREEAERERQGGAAPAKASWLGFWGEGASKHENEGRWAAEENVVRERTRRAQEVLEELEAPKMGLSTLFQV